MALESATFISELVATNPVGATDDVSVGDDHIRMLKTVLQTVFPNASKAFRFPTSEAKSIDFSVVSTDQNKTFIVTTTAAAVTATLPALASGDAGWEVFFVKITTDTNPLFIAPASGTIQSGEYAALAKTRRCIPGRRTRVLWTGTAWLAERVVDSPIGTVLDNWLAALPVGYELANGATLSSAANYPDYNAAKGSLVLPDVTGRVVAGLEAVATRLTNAESGIDGSTLGDTGGEETHALATSELAVHSHASGTYAVGTSITNGTSVLRGGNNVVMDDAGGGFTLKEGVEVDTLSLANGDVSGSSSNAGSGITHQNTQPTIVLRKIIVVE